MNRKKGKNAANDLPREIYSTYSTLRHLRTPGYEGRAAWHRLLQICDQEMAGQGVVLPDNFPASFGKHPANV